MGRPEAPEQEIIEALKKTNAWGFVSSFKDKLDTIVGNGGS